MIQYILRRLLILPLIIFLLTLILFFLMWQLPVEMRVQVYMPIGLPSWMTPEEEAELRAAVIEQYGLDRPFPVQYVDWLRNLATGNWGFSPGWNRPVLEGLLQRAPATAELALAAMIPSIVAAVLLGSFASRHRGRFPDHMVRTATFVGWAFPSFILGLILMNVFYAWLGWFPPQRLSVWAGTVVHSDQFSSYTGMHTVDALLNGELRIFWDALRHLVLPAVTLLMVEWALLTRIMRSSMLEALSQDYITTARSKGLPDRRVMNLHARRNALLPVISAGGIAASMLISGIVVVETIFSVNGIGAGAAQAIILADIPVAVGFTIFSCIVVVLASLIADILYAVVDPRVRLY